MAISWDEYRTELRFLFRIGWPMTVSVLFYALMYPATLAFSGSLGLLQLDIASLAVSVFQLVVVPVENGLRWSCLTFFSQSMGSSKKKRAGIIVQRSLAAAVFMWVISCGLALNCANLLVLIGQDAEIAAGSQTFITILLPGCLAVLIFRVEMAYMDCLQRVYPTLAMHTICFFLCMGLEALLVFPCQLGVNGAAIGLCVSLCTLPVMMTAYICCSGAHKDTWPGWSLRSLLQWKQFYHNLVPSVANQLVFVFSSEMGTFVAGALGKNQLAVQGIIFQLFIVTLQPCIGAGSAAVTRIGNYMAAGRHEKSKQVYVVILLLLVGIGALESLTLLALKDVIPKIFSTDAETEELFSSIIYFVIPYTFIIASAWGHVAAMRGCNYHHLCTIVAFISLWLIGHPVGLSLTFAAHWGMYGLWTGYVLSSCAWNIILLCCTLRLNWDSVSQKVAGSAEKETDVEGFVTHDESRPLLGSQWQKSADHEGPEVSDRLEPQISARKILRTKVAPVLALTLYFATAVAVRSLAPQPQFGQQPDNDTLPANATDWPL